MLVDQLCLIETRRKNLFIFLIFAVTAAPLVLYAAMGTFLESDSSLGELIFILGVIGFVHVGMTAYFYVGDSRYSKIIAGNKLRYFIFPGLLIAGSAVAFWLLAADQLVYYVTAYLIWSMWHFNRQNFGLYAIFLRSEGQPSASANERRQFDALCAGPMVIALSLLPVPDVFKNIFLVGGQAIFVVSAALLTREFVRLGRAGSKVCCGWLLLSILFFLPPALSSNPTIAFSFYAHPIQFCIMMGFLAGSESARTSLGSAARMSVLLVSGFGAFALFIGVLLGFPGSANATRAASTLLFGLAQWHFLVDAGLWRLRDASQRTNFEESFGFLFKRTV